MTDEQKFELFIKIIQESLPRMTESIKSVTSSINETNDLIEQFGDITTQEKTE